MKNPDDCTNGRSSSHLCLSVLVLRQVTIQKLVNGSWVDVTVPFTPGSTLSPADMAALASDPLATYQACSCKCIWNALTWWLVYSKQSRARMLKVTLYIAVDAIGTL